MSIILKTYCPFFFLLLFVVVKNSYGQNLVNNYSFEDTVACPGILRIDKAVGWMIFRDSPDYFNDCNNMCCGVPNNMGGFQYARSGIAYGGFVVKSLGSLNFHEIIGSSLNQPLVIGQSYYVSFYVNRSYNHLQFNNYNNLAANKIGLKFTTVPYSMTNPIALNNIAHIFTNSIITDTIGWTKISGTFTADSAYNYLAIGNFFDDSLTSHIKLDSIASMAYYYVDDVCISTDSNYCNSISSLSHFDLENPINVFPNPVNDELNIQGIGFTKIVIYDNLGRIVFTKKFELPVYHTHVKLPILRKGLYFVKIKTLKSYYTKKIVHN